MLGLRVGWGRRPPGVALVCLAGEKENSPPTEFPLPPHRVYPNLGADRPETRFKGVEKRNPYLFGKDREKGGVRTAIEVSPVRVYLKRGAETPPTRFTPISSRNRLFPLSASSLPPLRLASPPNSVAGWGGGGFGLTFGGRCGTFGIMVIDISAWAGGHPFRSRCTLWQRHPDPVSRLRKLRRRAR